MNLIELHQLRQLRLGGMAAVLETRLQQAQAEAMAPIDLISCLVTDELTREIAYWNDGASRPGFRDSLKTLDNFDFSFNKKMNRSLLFELASGNLLIAGRCTLSWSTGVRKEAIMQAHWPGGHSTRSSRALSGDARATRRTG